MLVLCVESTIYFANYGNLCERITWWIDDDDEQTSSSTWVVYNNLV